MDSIKLLKAAVLTGALSLSILACSQKGQDTAEVGTQSSSIIGGSQVGAEDLIAKSTVAIIASVTTQDGQEGQSICTGSLLSDDTVLTAAHCVPSEKEFKSVALYVIFNRDLNAMQRTDVRLVTSSVVHPEYEKSTGPSDTHDVAILRFAGTKASGYDIAQFLDDETVLKQGMSVTLAGYGLNETDGVNTKNDNTLRRVNVQIYDKFGNHEIILDQTQGKGACHGDSGGPAFIEINGVQHLWGITSRGAGKNGVDDCSLASIYTKVKSERAFIEGAVLQLSKKQSFGSSSEGLNGEGI